MSIITFHDKLLSRISNVNSLLCIGLDPHESELFPQSLDDDVVVVIARTDEEKCDAAYTFCKSIIDETFTVAACYKPNVAFFEALGNGGLKTLQDIITTLIPKDIPILLDVKRGDIGTTASAYATACYDYLQADAVTLSPFMGYDSIEPFVTGKYAGKGAFLLCKTSNPGSNDFMNQNIIHNEKNYTLYEHVASLACNEWNDKLVGTGSSLGLVIGATDPEAIRSIRRNAMRSEKDVWILAPGVGAQGGSLEDTVTSGINPRTGLGLLIPVSRAISKASDPAATASDLRQRIESARKIVMDKYTALSIEKNDSPELLSSKIQDYQRQFIEFSISHGVLKFGSFVLKSGRTSPYFFNAGLFATGAALYNLGKAYASAIVQTSSRTDICLVRREGTCLKPEFDVIFGPAYKGISLGAVVSSTLYSDFGIDVGFAFNRKEAKDHGEGGSLVGSQLTGKRILIIDDVITAGTAIREVCSLLEQVEAKPIGVVIALDRSEIRSLEDPISAVQAVERDMSLKVVSIVNLTELQTFLEQSPDYDDATLQSVISYRSKYGA